MGYGIVKIQISDNNNIGKPQMLIYNEDESFLSEYEPTKAELKALKYKKGLFKQYWIAKLPKKKGKVELLERVCNEKFSPNW